MVLNKPIISELIKDILDFIGDLPLLGHNIIFDYSFLKRRLSISIIHLKNKELIH